MKQRKYKHISKAERLEIAILLGKSYGIREIAKVLKRSPGTISDEIERNSVDGIYDPKKAQYKAYSKRKHSKYQGMRVVQNDALRKYVKEKMKDDWSPEEISGRLKEINKDIKYASRGAIYKFVYSVYGRRIEKYLRYKGKKKRKREKVTQLKDRVFVDERPQIIEEKQRFGDWEGDFIVSGKDGKGALIVLYERRTMYTIIRKLLNRDCMTINRYLREMINGFVCFNSLTVDNDISFTKHQELSRILRCPIYFCHPYHSWEKGGVENMNGLIRQYILKGSDISQYDEKYIKEIETKINNRPRKTLGYKTPLEIMMENNQFKIIPESVIINKQKTPVRCSA